MGATARSGRSLTSSEIALEATNQASRLNLERVAGGQLLLEPAAGCRDLLVARTFTAGYGDWPHVDSIRLERREANLRIPSALASPRLIIRKRVGQPALGREPPLTLAIER